MSFFFVHCTGNYIKGFVVLYKKREKRSTEKFPLTHGKCEKPNQRSAKQPFEEFQTFIVPSCW